MSVEIDPQNEGTIAVMAANWPSLEAFMECSTQWRTEAVTMGGAGGIMTQIVFLGLDYKSCETVFQDLDAKPHVFRDVRAMEHAALPVLNEVE
ncbi:DUF1799 domain-containing protein [Shinella sp. M31]|uniref:DUF1799 domain-containing protein n=1 Tax=Shinella sp. M31 TaxID=3368615 RepID=UPI003BA1CB78